MDQEAVRFAQGILRDLVLVCLAVFMLVHETVEDSSPDPLIVGAALTLLGVPAAVRLDDRRRVRNGTEPTTTREY